jgi:integrase
MKVNRYGQSKILTSDEMEALFSKGFRCARDKAFFAICRYTACRFSEARQMLYTDVFRDDQARSKMLFRRRTTKGKLGTREVDTHPALANFLNQYRQDSLRLVELIKEYGRWNYFGPKKPLINKSCPKCGSTRTNRDGIAYRYLIPRQRYECTNCNFHFEPANSLETSNSSNRRAELESNSITLGIGNSVTFGLLFMNSNNPFLFPGTEGQGFISFVTPQRVLAQACTRLNITGVSTHSFRRTALTELHNQGVPLRVIQRISGHRSLDALQRYFEVSDEQVRAAINSLNYKVI